MRAGFKNLGFLAGLLLGVALGAALVALSINFLDADIGSEGTLADEATGVIEQNYWKEVDGESLEQASVRGMIQRLRREYDDRFSYFFDPEQLANFRQSTAGSFSGVGMTVTEAGRGLRIVSVIPDSPAERADLQKDDLIVAVDGEAVAGQPADAITAKIKGPAGSQVSLRVVPADGSDRYTVEVERADVRVPAVAGRMRPGDDEPKIGYLRFATFSRNSHQDLRAEAERLYDRGAEGLIIDMRANGGGLLDEAVLSASVFVEDGLIVSTRARNGGDREFDAQGDALDPRPLVILTDGDTASAAEIFTAALDAHDLATIVGSKTFGKGVFQEIFELPSGGALDLTVGEYYTADGTSLAGDGIEPDEAAEDDSETPRDEAFDKALEVLERLIQQR